MIEIPRPPSAGVMACLTFLTEGSFMLVVFFMATNTGEWRILKCRRHVTLLAFNLGMTSSQSKAGLVVIKRRIFPLSLVVATLALVTELALMLVVLLVASYASILQFALVYIAFLRQMAGIALGLPMLGLERILGFPVVIKDAGFPVLGRVTGATFIAITALVAFLVIILAMTGNTLHVHLQFPGIGTTDTAFMAGLALGILVFVA